jgi:biotin-(acetyl-CoA carboxylase) ligase
MIKVSAALKEIEGTVHNIDSLGALVIRKENGSLERIMAGDIRMIA